MPIKDEIIIPRKGDQSLDGDFLPGTDGRWNVGSLVKRWRGIFAKNITAESYSAAYGSAITPGMIMVGYAGGGTASTPSIGTSETTICTLAVTVDQPCIAHVFGRGAAQCSTYTAVQDIIFNLKKGSTIIDQGYSTTGFQYYRHAVPLEHITTVDTGTTTFYIRAYKSSSSNTVGGSGTSQIWVVLYS